jgi:AcrR family transcriptional regulator
MPERYTLPLSELNTIIPGDRFEDVTLVIPQLQDIREEITAATNDLTDIRQEIDDALDRLIDDAPFPLDIVLKFFEELEEQADAGEPLTVTLAQTIAVEVAEALTGEDLDFRDIVDEAIEEAIDAAEGVDVGDITVTIDGSLFSLQEDFVDILARALSEASFADIDELGDIEQFIDDVTGFIDALEDFADDPEQFIRDEVQTALEEFLDTELDDQLLTDPIGVLADAITDAVTSGIDESTQEELRKAADEFR